MSAHSSVKGELESARSTLDLSIIIASWNVGRLLADCLSSLPEAVGGHPYVTIVVDNASSDGSADVVERDFGWVRLIRNTENTGYAMANNQGLREAHSPYALLLNSDTLLPPGALASLVEFMDCQPDAGACSPRLVRLDGTPQPYAYGGDPTLSYLLRRGASRLILHRPLHNWAVAETQPVDWVSGACLLLRRSALDQVGLLDERFFMYFEDNDLCLRLRQAGWRIYYYPEAAITHLGGQSLRQNPKARRAYQASLRYFYAKHYGRLAQVALRLALQVYNILMPVVLRSRDNNNGEFAQASQERVRTDFHARDG